MGAALEEEWGSANFLAFFLVSTIAMAMIASWIGVALLGASFVYFSLVFVYASAFPEQTLYLFALIPIRVRWLAYIAAGLLVYGAAIGGTANVPVLGGALVGYVFFLLHRVPATPSIDDDDRGNAPPKPHSPELVSVRNAARFVAIKKSLANASDVDIDRLITQSEHEIVRGVNICPPADYKPEHNDGYCIRCEGFAECSARHLRLNRPRTATATLAVPSPEV